jgi:steroid 5-alpha reductase family enzyme
MVFVLDGRYLAITALLTLAWQFGFFIPAALLKFDKVTDFAYGTNFFALALFTFFLAETFYARQIVITVLVSIWGIRLAGYLFYRIVKIGSDHRFDSTRENPIRFGIWFLGLQFPCIWAFSLPYILLNASTYDAPLNWRDYLGWALFAIGFLCESIADQQKFSFKNNPNNKNHWCDVGLWKLSRHPNYFGEIMLWWGIYSSSSSVFSGADWIVTLSPFLVTLLLMFGSGIPTTEKSTDQRFWANEEYQKWKANTPVLVPFVPGLFRGVAKVLFCCEWTKLYNYPPTEKAQLNEVVAT